MFYYFLLILSSTKDELEFHKRSKEFYESETMIFKENYIYNSEFRVFTNFIQDINLECRDLHSEECNEVNCNIYMAKKIFNFCYFVFDNNLPLGSTLFKHALDKSNPLDLLILKLHYYFCNGLKLEKIFIRSDSIEDFFKNKHFLGDFYDKTIVKNFKEEEKTFNLKSDSFMKFLYKIYLAEFDNILLNIDIFKNRHIKLVSILPKLQENETHYVMITKKRFIQGKKLIKEKSKRIKKVRKENVSYIQSEMIKKLIYFMDCRITFQNVEFIEYFLYFLKYFCLKADLHLTLVIEVLPGFVSKCQIISVDGTNIKNIMTYYSAIADKTEVITKNIKERIEEDRMHGFTTFQDQNKYSFDSKEGFSMGEQDCLLLSCSHYLGNESKEEWFNNFMQRCAYCNLYASPIAYFKAEVFRVPELVY